MEEELDLMDLFFTFWKKKWIIVIFLALGIVAGYIYTKFFVTPRYSSSVTMILAKASSTADINTDYDEAITTSDITLNQKLISTYGELMKSKRVTTKVISNLNLDMSFEEIKKGISVSSVKDTDLIKLTVTTENPDLSAKIANEMLNVFTEEVDRIYNIKNVSPIDLAEVNKVPVNINYKKNMAIFGVVSALLVCAIIFVIYYFDNTLKDEEDIKKIIDLPVLSTIPQIDDKDKGGR